MISLHEMQNYAPPALTNNTDASINRADNQESSND
jgi:hypothetical protein